MGMYPYFDLIMSTECPKYNIFLMKTFWRLIIWYNLADEDNGDTDGVGDGGDAGGDAGGDNGDEDDEDDEDGEDDEDDEDDDVGEGEDDGGDAGGYEIGDDGGGESTCVCGDWDFPGECGSDGLIFR